MSADHILDFTREVELRRRVITLTNSLVEMIRMVEAAQRHSGMYSSDDPRFARARAAVDFGKSEP